MITSKVLCCVLVLVRSKNFLSPVRAAAAFSGRQGARRLVATHFHATGKINGEGSEYEQQHKRPQTGWSHKQPSGPSDFWNGPRDEKSQPSKSPNQPRELRTGWLHNSKPSSDNQEAKSASGGATSGKVGTASMARRRLELAKLQQERNHRLISPPTFHACGEDRVVAVTEHLVSVPVFRDGRTSSERIDVYFCIIEKVESDTTRLFLQQQLASTALSPSQRAAKYIEHSALQNADSMVLYLQGGPGFGAPTPAVGLGIGKGSGSWADAALYTAGYSRVVLMDQRGTGRSSPITKQTLERKFPDLFLLDEDSSDSARNSRSLDDFVPSRPEHVEIVKQAVDQVTDYLAQFRADNIIQDAEFIREAMILPTLSDDTENDAPSERPPRPWGCSLGQSYGGFCQMTYLSQVEHPPRILLFTGGIAPMLSDVVDVYRVLWDRVKERSLRYYEMYPGDIAAVKFIVRALLHQPAKLPSGGWLTARRFLSLGITLGGSPSSFASLHELISSAVVVGTLAAAQSANVADLEFSRAFLKQIDVQQSFDDHPIYFWLHESIYADGPERSPTNWAAERAYQTKLERDSSEFDFRRTSQDSSDDQPTLFFGEHVFSWMPDDFAELSGVGLRSVANALARKKDWSSLYDANHMKMVLADGRTRSAAAIYHEDMYVEFDACMKVTARTGL